jgi:hypothetical protein
MWVKYVTKNLLMMFPPLMGSLGRLVLVLAGQGIFLRITLIRKLHLNRRGGVPSGAAVFIVFGGMGASAPIFVIHSIHALPIQNSDEPFYLCRTARTRDKPGSHLKKREEDYPPHTGESIWSW